MITCIVITLINIIKTSLSLSKFIDIGVVVSMIILSIVSETMLTNCNLIFSNIAL